MKTATTFYIYAYGGDGGTIAKWRAFAPADPHTPEAECQAEEIIDDLDRMAGAWLADQGATRVEVFCPPGLTPAAVGFLPGEPA